MASHVRRTLTVLGVTALLASGMTGLSGTAFAEPPNIPDETTARSLLTGDDCYPTSGSWFSPFDEATWTDPQDVDIDHLVPLAEAWRTGASGWTQDQREDYANDITDPQLIAVTDNVNQEKGDKGPEAWKPPAEGYWCTYSKMWVAVKHKWQLSTSEDEMSALLEMLDRC